MNKMHHRHLLTRTHTAHVVTHALNADSVCRLCQLIMNDLNSRVRPGARKTSWSRGPPGNLPVSRWASPPLAISERLRGVFTTRHYTNPRLPLPYLYLLCTEVLHSRCVTVELQDCAQVTKKVTWMTKPRHTLDNIQFWLQQSKWILKLHK